MIGSAQSASQQQIIYVLRLKPHTDLKQSILEFAKANKIKAGAIVTCVGSLEQYHLRFANQENGTKSTGHFEVLSLSGTFSESAMHLHVAVADRTGKTIGGHLLDQNLVYTTIELVVTDLTDLVFTRETDSTYGYQELVIKKKPEKP
jgi:predicted DNA-binding protein with PD1-like motif